ncbi:MAG: RNA repair domain-containing protein [Methanobacteriota archaeon]
MPHIRDILNEIKWTKELKKTELWIVHRGAPQDTKIIQGSDVIAIEKSFFQTPSASIPYHRVFKILYDGVIIFER